MSRKEPIAVIKELRGQILSFLDDIYPYDIEITSIYSTYYQYYETETIDRVLQYLIDKEYVKEIKRAGTRLFEPTSHYKITPKGADLIEGSTEDRGITIRRA